MTDATHDPAFDRKYHAALRVAQERSAALEGPSLMERLARLPATSRNAILGEFSTLDLHRLLYAWGAWARPKQDPDLTGVAHRILFLLAGRGFGKSLSGAQRVRRRVNAGARSIGIIGPTLGEVEKYMIGGEGGADGLLSVFPPAQRPRWRAHKRIIEFHTGAIGYVNTAEEPEFRGPNLDSVWADEPGKWKYLKTMWSNIELATRLPGALELELIITGSPVPMQIFREWIADEETVTILGKMSENAANLDRTFVRSMQRKYGGTRLGRQELEGEILTDNPDALFHSTTLDSTRVEHAPATLEMAVAVDPAISTEPGNDATGIVAGGIDVDGHIYITADVSGSYSSEQWGKITIQAYDQCGAVAIVSERNRGGDLVAANIRAAQERRRGKAAAHAVKVVEVHATKGKRIRAEPVGALHEQGRLHIVGVLPELEKEITEWNPRLGGVSPNRLDALVWLVWYLARLGEEEELKPDYAKGFRGLTSIQAQAPAPAAPRVVLGGLTGLTPRGAWGSRL